MRKKGKNELGKTFTNIINYDINQWKKYDLLVSQGNKINVLTVITKKIVRKYVTIYFTSLAKLQYTHKDFILINKSINETHLIIFIL